jgi:uncharacterized protein (TIGR02646 family)
MRRFARQAEPDFWGAYERRWLYETTGKNVDPLTWRRKTRTLAAWFHELARAGDEARGCAYCDGLLGAVSPATVDHFLPQAGCRQLALSWANLYPACVQCNSTFKGTRASCALVRPDVDPVEAWFDFDEVTGRLEPSPEIDLRSRARVRLTIRVFGLNTTLRCVTRKQMLRDLSNALLAGRLDHLEQKLKTGPYRFVTRKFMQANQKRIAAAV